VRKELILRVKALEQLLPDDAKATKTVLPEWLIEELRKQGSVFDASGRPDMTSVSSGACRQCDLDYWRVLSGWRRERNRRRL
jgi:hypothetical protein